LCFWRFYFYFFLNTIVMSTFFQYLLHQFVSQFLFNSIQCIWIQFENLNSIQVGMQCDSTFSFEWNLIFIKTILFFFFPSVELIVIHS
jgi:hypothetical protein